MFIIQTLTRDIIIDSDKTKNTLCITVGSRWKCIQVVGACVTHYI